MDSPQKPQEQNTEKVNIAVKIKLQIDRYTKKSQELKKDLNRLIGQMSGSEYNEYAKRIWS